MKTVFKSYGIACCRKRNDKYEILFIKKRNTYSFIEFVRGKYDMNKKYEILHLLNGMTIEEKLDIKLFDYMTLWLRCYQSYPSVNDIKNNTFYSKNKKKFDGLYGLNGGNYLNYLIERSENCKNYWEIPKGRNSKYESLIDTAVREFNEETNIPKKKYKILFDIDKQSYSFIDNGITYIYYYYLAILTDNRYNPTYSFNSIDVIKETTDISFLSLEQIRLLNNNRLYNFSKNVIKKIKKNI